MRRALLILSALMLVVMAVVLASREPRPEPLPVEPSAPSTPSAPGAHPPLAPTAVDAGAADASSGPAGDADAGAPIDAGVREVVSVDAGVMAAVVAVPSPLDTMDASVRGPKIDPRFTIRWGQAGLCGEEPLERMAQRRAALLASFIGVRRAGALILRHPEVPPDFVDLVGDSIADARIIVTRLLGPNADVTLPVIYVYESAEQMRDVACVNTATAGYYDGAIHLPASDLDYHRTVIHEHVHHVLNTLGLRKPMWLHEGLAMYAADERWWEDPRLGLTSWLRSAHLPFPALTEAFPHTADELFAGAAYYQSFQMVSFVADRSGQPDFYWLVDALLTGRLEAQSSFGESVGLSGDQLEDAWRVFVQSH